MGSPPMNFIPLRLQRKGGRLVGLLDSADGRCELPLDDSDEGLEGREVILGVRPEQVLVGGGSGALPGIRAEVQVLEPTGPDTLAFVEINQAKVCVRLAPDAAPLVGETLDLQFAPDKVLLFDAQSGERLGVLGNARSPERAKVARLKGM
ncbi:sn-glycerol-3-phosphate import ATP-binding protein UgpC [compost metagenome]